MASVLFIDNFDSFTYNLVDEFCSLHHQVTVVRNNIPLDKAVSMALASDILVISPGPGSPQDAGICSEVIKQLNGVKPILGICLGHQLMVETFGGKVERAPVPVHGKIALIEHHQEYFFSSLPSPLAVGRYHSLIATKIPSGFEVLAQVNGLVMSVFDPQRRMAGMQFHPESILTTEGSRLLKQTIDYLLNQGQ